METGDSLKNFLSQVLTEKCGITLCEDFGILESGDLCGKIILQTKIKKNLAKFQIDFDQKKMYRFYESFTNLPTSIIDVRYATQARKKYTVHPTAKPVPVLEFLLDRYTQKGYTVLDITMGSGSTGVACKRKQRDFIGIQISSVWYNIAEQRIEQTEIVKEVEEKHAEV